MSETSEFYDEGDVSWGEPPQMTAEEAEAEEKSAAVDNFVTLLGNLVDAIDALAELGISDNYEGLRDLALVAKYHFSTDLDDHSLEDLT